MHTTTQLILYVLCIFAMVTLSTSYDLDVLGSTEPSTSKAVALGHGCCLCNGERTVYKRAVSQPCNASTLLRANSNGKFVEHSEFRPTCAAQH